MTKCIVLVAGLPASGKDTVAKFFSENGYDLLTYSGDILKPIIESPKGKLKDFLEDTVDDKVPEEKVAVFVSEIEVLKKKEKGRELYISVAQYLNKVCSEVTNGQFNHFSLFLTCLMKDFDRVVVSGFRQKPELDILKEKFLEASLKTVFVDCDDEIRYKRLVKRDGIDMKTVFQNEIYEIETTYNKMMKEVDFDFEIRNDKGVDELEEKVLKVIGLI